MTTTLTTRLRRSTDTGETTAVYGSGGDGRDAILPSQNGKYRNLPSGMILRDWKNPTTFRPYPFWGYERGCNYDDKVDLSLNGAEKCLQPWRMTNQKKATILRTSRGCVTRAQFGSERGAKSERGFVIMTMRRSEVMKYRSIQTHLSKWAACKLSTLN